jgi:hypothetical protein
MSEASFWSLLASLPLAFLAGLLLFPLAMALLAQLVAWAWS